MSAVYSAFPQCAYIFGPLVLACSIWVTRSSFTFEKLDDPLRRWRKGRKWDSIAAINFTHVIHDKTPEAHLLSSCLCSWHQWLPILSPPTGANVRVMPNLLPQQKHCKIFQKSPCSKIKKELAGTRIWQMGNLYIDATLSINIILYSFYAKFWYICLIPWRYKHIRIW